jgi:hypothetical protein
MPLSVKLTQGTETNLLMRGTRVLSCIQKNGSHLLGMGASHLSEREKDAPYVRKDGSQLHPEKLNCTRCALFAGYSVRQECTSALSCNLSRNELRYLLALCGTSTSVPSIG